MSRPDIHVQVPQTAVAKEAAGTPAGANSLNVTDTTSTAGTPNAGSLDAAPSSTPSPATSALRERPNSTRTDPAPTGFRPGASSLPTPPREVPRDTGRDDRDLDAGGRSELRARPDAQDHHDADQQARAAVPGDHAAPGSASGQDADAPERMSGERPAVRDTEQQAVQTQPAATVLDQTDGVSQQDLDFAGTGERTAAQHPDTAPADGAAWIRTEEVADQPPDQTVLAAGTIQEAQALSAPAEPTLAAPALSPATEVFQAPGAEQISAQTAAPLATTEPATAAHTPAATQIVNLARPAEATVIINGAPNSAATTEAATSATPPAATVLAPAAATTSAEAARLEPAPKTPHEVALEMGFVPENPAVLEEAIATVNDRLGHTLQRTPALVILNEQNIQTLHEQAANGNIQLPNGTHTKSWWDKTNGIIFMSEAHAVLTFPKIHEVTHAAVAEIAPDRFDDFISEEFARAVLDKRTSFKAFIEKLVIAKILDEGIAYWLQQDVNPDQLEQEVVTLREGKPAPVAPDNWIDDRFTTLKEGINAAEGWLEITDEGEQARTLEKIIKISNGPELIVGGLFFGKIAAQLRQEGLSDAELATVLKNILQNPPQTIDQIKEPATYLNELQTRLAFEGALDNETGTTPTFVASERLTGENFSSNAIVYEATFGGVTIAVKASPDDLTRESDIASLLHHPNILPLVWAGKARMNTAAIDLDWNDGAELNTLVYRKIPDTLATRLSQLTNAELLAILRQQLAAIQYAHTEGIVHADVRPENILLDGTTSFLTDFDRSLQVGIDFEERDAGWMKNVDYSQFMVMLKEIGEQRGIAIFSTLTKSDEYNANYATVDQVLTTFESPTRDAKPEEQPMTTLDAAAAVAQLLPQGGRQQRAFKIQIEPIESPPILESAIPQQITEAIISAEALPFPFPKLSSAIIDNFIIDQIQHGIVAADDIAATFVQERIPEKVAAYMQKLKEQSDLLNWDKIFSPEDYTKVKTKLSAEMAAMGMTDEQIGVINRMGIQITEDGGVSSLSNDNIYISKLQILRRALNYQHVFGPDIPLEDVLKTMMHATAGHELGHQIDNITPGYAVNHIPSDRAWVREGNSQERKDERFAEYWGQVAVRDDDIQEKIRQIDWALIVAKNNLVWETVRSHNATHESKVELFKVFIAIKDKLRAIDPSLMPYLESLTLSYGSNAAENYASAYDKETVTAAVKLPEETNAAAGSGRVQASKDEDTGDRKQLGEPMTTLDAAAAVAQLLPQGGERAAEAAQKPDKYTMAYFESLGITPAPDFARRLAEQVDELQTVDHWLYNVGDYSSLKFALELPEKAASESESNHEVYLSELIDMQLRENPGQRVIALDIGGARGQTWCRLAKKYEKEIEAGKVVLVVSNLSNNPEDFNFGDVLRNQAGESRQEAELFLEVVERKLVHFVTGPFAQLPDAEIDLPDGTRMHLKNNVTLAQEAASMSRHSRVPELDIPEALKVMAPGGVYLVRNTFHDFVATGGERPPNDTENNYDRDEGVSIAHQAIRERLGIHLVTVTEPHSDTRKDYGPNWMIFMRSNNGGNAAGEPPMTTFDAEVAVGAGMETTGVTPPPPPPRDGTDFLEPSDDDARGKRIMKLVQNATAQVLLAQLSTRTGVDPALIDPVLRMVRQHPDASDTYVHPIQSDKSDTFVEATIKGLQQRPSLDYHEFQDTRDLLIRLKNEENASEIDGVIVILEKHSKTAYARSQLKEFLALDYLTHFQTAKRILTEELRNDGSDGKVEDEDYFSFLSTIEAQLFIREVLILYENIFGIETVDSMVKRIDTGDTPTGFFLHSTDGDAYFSRRSEALTIALNDVSDIEGELDDRGGSADETPMTSINSIAAIGTEAPPPPATEGLANTVFVAAPDSLPAGAATEPGTADAPSLSTTTAVPDVRADQRGDQNAPRSSESGSGVKAQIADSKPELATGARGGNGIGRTTGEAAMAEGEDPIGRIRNEFEQPLDRSESPEKPLEAQIADRLEVAIRYLQPGASITNAAELADIAGVEVATATSALDAAYSARLILALPDKHPYVVRIVKDQGMPIREHVKEAIQLGIDKGILVRGDPFPGIRQWHDDYDMPPGQVARLFRELTEAGLISGRPRRGTVITGEPLSAEERLPAKTRVIESIQRQIATGELKTGDRIASNSALAVQFDTSPSNIGLTMDGPELSSLLIQESRGRKVVAEISPIDQITLFLQEYLREGGRVPTAGRPIEGRTATQDITTFLREYIHTRDSGERLPSMPALSQMFGVSIRPIVDAFDQLKTDQLIISTPRGTRIAGEYVTDPMRIETYVDARLESLPPGEPLPSIQTLAYELATLKGIKPVIIESAEQITALLRTYISYLNPGDMLPSHTTLDSLFGTTNSRPAFEMLRNEGLIDSDTRGARVSGDYILEAERVEAGVKELLVDLQQDERLPTRSELAELLETNDRILYGIFAKLRRENLVYLDKYTYATGVARARAAEAAEAAANSGSAELPEKNGNWITFPSAVAVRTPAEAQRFIAYEQRIDAAIAAGNPDYQEADSPFENMSFAEVTALLENPAMREARRAIFFNLLARTIPRIGLRLRNDADLAILDSACGDSEVGPAMKSFLTGRRLRSYGERATIYGIDSNREEIEQARRNNAPTDRFMVGDASDLTLFRELPDEFDVIFMRHQNLQNRDTQNSWIGMFYQNLARLKNDGILFATSYTTEEHQLAVSLINIINETKFNFPADFDYEIVLEEANEHADSRRFKEGAFNLNPEDKFVLIVQKKRQGQEGSAEE